MTGTAERGSMFFAILLTAVLSVWFTGLGVGVLGDVADLLLGIGDSYGASVVLGDVLFFYLMALPVLFFSLLIYVTLYLWFGCRIHLLILHLLGGLCGFAIHGLYFSLMLRDWVDHPAILVSGFTAGVAGSVIFVRAYERVWWRRGARARSWTAGKADQP